MALDTADMRANTPAARSQTRYRKQSGKPLAATQLILGQEMTGMQAFQ